jgi:hypothetical protein
LTHKPFLVLAFACCSTAFGQGERTPQPAPELKEINFLAGTWKTEAEVKPSSMGPGGKMTSVDRYEWQKGNFFLIGNVAYKSTMGDGVELFVMGYDSAKKAFTYDAFNSSGERIAGRGSKTGDTIVWTNTNDAPFKWRYIEKILSPTSMSIKFEASPDGGSWNTIMEGKSTKQ